MPRLGRLAGEVVQMAEEQITRQAERTQTSGKAGIRKGFHIAARAAAAPHFEWTIFLGMNWRE